MRNTSESTKSDSDGSARCRFVDLEDGGFAARSPTHQHTEVGGGFAALHHSLDRIELGVDLGHAGLRLIKGLDFGGYKVALFGVNPSEGVVDEVAEFGAFFAVAFNEGAGHVGCLPGMGRAQGWRNRFVGCGVLRPDPHVPGALGAA